MNNNEYATLSSAIRFGAKLAGRCTGQMLQIWADGPHTCALGSAVHAITGDLPQDTQAEYTMLSEVFPYTRQLVQCAECEVETNLRDTVFHFNDVHGWSREKISDWLEQWENEHLGYETLTESEVTTDETPATLSLQQEASLQG